MVEAQTETWAGGGPGPGGHGEGPWAADGGADMYLGGRDGLETRLPTMGEVAGNFDGVR